MIYRLNQWLKQRFVMLLGDHHCKGKGQHHTRIEYEDPEPRKKRPDVLRVLQINPGICVGSGNGLTIEQFGGMPYDEWLTDKPFPEGSEMREFTCPAWWYQSADYDKKPDWEECIGCGSFSGCKSFPKKAECWERFDREQKSQ